MALPYSPMKGLLLFHLLVLTLLMSPISCNKVALGLYYESLCPYSASFIIDSLARIFTNGLIDIVDLDLVPWGNTKLYGNHTFKCQHGPNECLLNTVEACAIDVWPDVKVYFPFVYCVESLVYHHNYTHWDTCFEKLGLDASPVADCYSGERGRELELKYAAETNALDPPHRYVPWVVVDGQPLYDDYRDFISYICKAYKGTDPPSACTESSVGGIWKVKMNTIQSLYGQETVMSKLFRAGQAIVSWLQGNKIVDWF
ncbi:gamma-interferon-inducible lysosomal thiol reductase isoform X1 [Sesamum indicum]|uniref:Gamma-interferon-inducible lysosomal thiol reductase isoform X1 n=1 Tax=Sesamum indicum TaxID=4182 RepID=A0A6I9U627_SESIN|nr:gamma-interferon-inducible lysosomal thiol reductase isoform X1 [Sesamum indicum]